MAHTMLQGENAAYLEAVLEQYLADPGSVDPSWRAFFEGPGRELAEGPAPVAGPSFESRSLFAPPPVAGPQAAASAADLSLLRSQGRIFQLINAYRVRGHLQARLDPLGHEQPVRHLELEPDYWGFSEEDWSRTFSTATLYGPQQMTLRELHAWLRETYSRTIGCEFMHIHDVRIKNWLQERFERNKNHCALDHDTQVFLYEQLCKAEAFEDFLHVKYRGAKRFSLEGAETLIPLLGLTIEEVARRGVVEVVIGMAHRGRLNVLTNVLGKRQRSIFSEFDDTTPEEMFGRGDVKYHLGYDSDVVTRFGDEVHLTLAFNPSHLEAIDPVVEGKVRARQDRRGDTARQRVLPILIHGDAAFAGQGLVFETLNMSALDGYTTGGTIHIVVNNQIGFTTLPRDARSTVYCTDVAKMGQIPIMHVNGEDPEAVAHVARIAAEFRHTFQRDVIIDMYCFRRYGHNESDEPAFTQPVMYDAIDTHPAVHEQYRELLLARGRITKAEVEEMENRLLVMLESELDEARQDGATAKADTGFRGVWRGYLGGPDADAPHVDTGVTEEEFDAVVAGLTTVPDAVHVHPKVKRLLARRREVVDPEVPIDWGMGELIAYGSLVRAGHPVRMSGQDCIRGTFSHRHAGVFDVRDQSLYLPLAHMAPEQGRVEIYNSLLSENAVVGFEYGYALNAPEALVIWEAQFGDFANGAQIMFDQFISASEDKWNRLSAVTLLLPHGFEGQGPEHSSARLERFLQLCAEDNMQVCNLTTPAQIFHALRRQVLRKWRKPLVVMTPKSLLRHKRAVSHRPDFVGGRFRRVLPEETLPSLANVRRAVLCSGKVYYDLLERREAMGDDTTALIRVEQLYPFPEAHIREALAALPRVDEVVWCQEEPENMGARTYLHPLFTRMFDGGPAVRWVAREASASPATGSPKAHRIEQEDLLDRTFDTSHLRSEGI
ncbi:MAG: 2-oxoglutarate dehydrogenase E1 component [Deltaproteobacteria bacterium]|nr:MAG: 2-oxoglutarate dehydrogenase E1 component [Deltaproteobacteria bacterium]